MYHILVRGAGVLPGYQSRAFRVSGSSINANMTAYGAGSANCVKVKLKHRQIDITINAMSRSNHESCTVANTGDLSALRYRSMH